MSCRCIWTKDAAFSVSREIKWRNSRNEATACLCLDIVKLVMAFDIYVRERRTMDQIFENGEARLIKTRDGYRPTTE
jgi:hypothetical protein